MNLQDYLIEKGFETYRKRYNRKLKEWEYIKETKDNDFFSTMSDLDIRYIKDKIEIVYGLHEHGKPPTLIFPRPNIKVLREEGKTDEEFDDNMNICLQKETPKDIFKAMFDKSITFTYDLCSV